MIKTRKLFRWSIY